MTGLPKRRESAVRISVGFQPHENIPKKYAPPLRVYIQGAFGIPVNSKGWVIGPDWINGAKYVIRGKPAESMQMAMQTMTAAQRSKQE